MPNKTDEPVSQEELRRKIEDLIVDTTLHPVDASLRVMQLITKATAQSNLELLDRVEKRINNLEIDIEATIAHMEKAGIAGDKLEIEILNVRIEADDRKDILKDCITAIQSERDKL